MPADTLAPRNIPAAERMCSRRGGQGAYHHPCRVNCYSDMRIRLQLRG